MIISMQNIKESRGCNFSQCQHYAKLEGYVLSARYQLGRQLHRSIGCPSSSESSESSEGSASSDWHAYWRPIGKAQAISEKKGV